jgi:vacuole morphology and inheritance protein 14
MLLPQSSAFGALKNRLNSVSAIGLLHTPPSMPMSSRPSVVGGISTSSLPNAPGSSVLSGPLAARRGRDTQISGASDLKWPELLEKFKQTQDRARRRNERLLRRSEGGGDPETPSSANPEAGGRTSRASLRSIGGDADARAGHKSQSGLGRPLAPGVNPSFKSGGLGSNLTSGGQAGSNARAALASVEGGGGAREHKRGHSLAGGFGKFASGIARAGGSRDREKKK